MVEKLQTLHFKECLFFMELEQLRERQAVEAKKRWRLSLTAVQGGIITVGRGLTK